jgi:hypothetical protein
MKIKVVCINVVNHEDELTLNKVYEFEKVTSNILEQSAYFMISDSGRPWTFLEIPQDRFIGLEEWRQKQFNKLGI